jgi:hypothetical protein
MTRIVAIGNTNFIVAHDSQSPIAADANPDFTSAFGGITDMAGSNAGSTQSQMTRLGHERFKIFAPQLDL